MAVRVAFVGVGGIAETHLKALSDNEHAEVVAACDVVPERAERAAETYGLKAYSDVDLMLDREKPDALFICVPPFAHADLEEKAAGRGIHLLVEKPLGLDREVIRSKADTIRQAGVLVATGYCLRYLDVAQQARHYLSNKEIGMVRAHYLSGFVETPWWRDMAKSGGQLVEQATHTVDITRYLAGDVKSVYARMKFGLLEHKPGTTIPSVATVCLDFESGAVGHIDTSCIQSDWSSAIEVLGRDFKLTLAGRKLTILEGEETTTYGSVSGSAHKTQDDAFIEAIRTGDRSLILSTYDDALKTVDVTLAANESALSGQPIVLL
ncbi:oxidoreductase [Paenibacillus sp. MY03]|uniref:Gfo/Idh/MocA family protein n=1 Tax=Paenibacillus sp. MY03 TaxID=302980 RepID=UPI000B3C8318|nr:Gfo/Idh/MocA family oxidoreductase [Paenibacillus sp. MY03]OUS75003.1 oxidoreductase [Paenibacillus sp. MY03]